MNWRDRILDDGTDREQWLAARRSVVGASDAAKLAKASSVDRYLAAKLDRTTWHGNDYTASGNRWEPMMLAWAGIAPNHALIHAPTEPGFAATPDGIEPVTGDRVRLAECKAKHGRIVDGPSLGEWRQIAWQFLCVPEAVHLDFIWVELDAEGEIRAGLNGEPKHLFIPRNHPKVVDLTARLLPIATDLLARLRVALDFERELMHA